MNTVFVVIGLERIQLPFQVGGIPKQGTIHELPPDGSYETFNKGMGNGHVRYCFDFLNSEDSQIGPPSMKPKQWIIIRAEISRVSKPDIARFSIRQSAGPSTSPVCTAKLMIRRVNWSMTTRTQWLFSRIDSQRNRSTLQRLSFA